jgi:hypothetical protein
MTLELIFEVDDFAPLWGMLRCNMDQYLGFQHAFADLDPVGKTISNAWISVVEGRLYRVYGMVIKSIQRLPNGDEGCMMFAHIDDCFPKLRFRIDELRMWR